MVFDFVVVSTAGFAVDTTAVVVEVAEAVVASVEVLVETFVAVAVADTELSPEALVNFVLENLGAEVVSVDCRVSY